MKYKAMLVDYDGCLVGLSHRITPRLKKAVGAAREKAIVAIATGRPLAGRISEALDELKIAGQHILFGGGAIYDWDKRKFLSKYVIPESEIFETVSLIHKNGFNFVADTVDKSFTLADPIAAERWYGPNQNYVPISPTNKQFNLLSRQKIVKIVAFVGKSSQTTEKIIDSLSQKLKNLKFNIKNLKFNKWFHNNIYGFDITVRSKLEAVNQFLKITNWQE